MIKSTIRIFLFIFTLLPFFSVYMTKTPFIDATYYYLDNNLQANFNEHHNTYLSFTSDSDLSKTSFEWEYDHMSSLKDISKFNQIILLWKLGKATIDNKKLYFRFDYNEIVKINISNFGNCDLYEVVLKTRLFLFDVEFIFGIFTKTEDYPEKKPLDILLKKIKQAKDK